MSNFWMKIKTFSKKHFILTIGVFWLLIVLLADFIVVTMNLQYDDNSLGTILILGYAIYGFPFWLVSKVMISFGIHEVIRPYLMTLLLFVALDLLVSGIKRLKARKK